MLFRFIIPSCDYYNMHSFLMYKESEKRNKVFMRTHRNCGSNRLCAPTIVFIQNEIVCFPTTKQAISLHAKTVETRTKTFLHKNHASRVGE